jgi:hypothetical protein
MSIIIPKLLITFAHTIAELDELFTIGSSCTGKNG